MAITLRSVATIALERLWFFCQINLIPNAINRILAYSHFLFGSSYALTIAGWVFIYAILRAFYVLVLYPVYFTPYRHLPAPKGRTLLWGNGPPMFTESPGVTTRRFAENIPNNGLIRYYGFLNQERLLVTSPRGLGEILVQQGYDFSKTFALKWSIARITGEGLGYAEGEQHKAQKKGLLPAFSYRNVKTMYSVFWKKGIEMVQCMEREIANQNRGANDEKAKSNVGTLVIRDWASRVTLDIIGVAGMDHDFEALQHPDNELNRIYRTLFSPPTRAMQIFGRLGFVANPRLLAMLPIKRNREIRECGAILRDVARQMIRQKRAKQSATATNDEEEDPTGPNTLIGVALKSDAFDEENLIAQMMTFLAAGHETTATAMQWVAWALCAHQDVQTRLREEIRAHLPPISSSSSSGPSIPDAAAVDALPYLSAVCAEVLRFYPPVPLTVREAQCDAVVLGTPVPKGTILVISAEATNHDTALWGPDADQFNPDRWLGPGRANSGGASTNYANMTFVHGPRSCIGATFSKSELMCLTAVLVGRFRLKLEDPKQTLKMAPGFILSPQDGVRARIEVLDGW